MFKFRFTLAFYIPNVKIRTSFYYQIFILLLEHNPLVRQYRLASSGNSNEIKLWTITSKSVLKHKSNTTHEVNIEPYDIYDGHTSSVTCIRYSNSGNYLVSSSLDKLVKIWDYAGNCVATLEGHTRYVNCVAISKDYSLIASGKCVRIYFVVK